MTEDMTADMSDDKMREAFEAEWQADPIRRKRVIYRRECDGDYADQLMNEAWWAWQAACRYQAERDAEIAEVVWSQPRCAEHIRLSVKERDE